MGIRKKERKTDIQIYKTNTGLARRQDMLNMITNAQTRLPQTILHDDLDKGFLEYVKKYVVISDGKQIPIIPRIMTIQRWGEITQNWQFSDSDENLQLPFIAVIRNPQVNYGTHPANAFNLPQNAVWHYATVPKWNGNQLGADIYKIPQPIPVDLKFEMVLVCTKFRDLNNLNRQVLENFSNIQDYQTVNGHYIPIVLDGVEDLTPKDNIENRRFYVQSYKFTMLGYLLDSELFDVQPAISRAFLMTEVMNEKQVKQISEVGGLEITTVTFLANGHDTIFVTGDVMGVLFNVSINGLLQRRDVDYYFIPGSTRVVFNQPPLNNSKVIVTYHKGVGTNLVDPYGNILNVSTEYFTYTGGTPIFQTQNKIEGVVSVDVNGLQEQVTTGYDVPSPNTFELKFDPLLNSEVGITYLY